MPTIAAIKPLIGVNSPSTISSAIKDWKKALAQTIKSEQGARPGIPAALLDAVHACWHQALAEARQVVNDQVDDLQGQQTALVAQEAALKAESERIHALLPLAEQHYQDERARLKKDHDRLIDETHRLTERAEHDRSRATEVEQENAVLKETLRQAHDKVQRLETQYDQQHDWSLSRIEEEKDRHRQHTQQELARYQAETKRSQHERALLQAKFDHLVNINAANRDRIIALERQLADEPLTRAHLTRQAAPLQNALNDQAEPVRLRLSQPKKRKE